MLLDAIRQLKKMKKPFRLIPLSGHSNRHHSHAQAFEPFVDQGQTRHGFFHTYAHSGQRFDYELDGVFHRQLNVRLPKVNLRMGRTLKKTKDEPRSTSERFCSFKRQPRCSSGCGPMR